MMAVSFLVILACTLQAALAQYDYGEVLQKSILFYEAERSGPLPGNNRVPWRGDSALDDGQDASLDLTGGWYDAGDHVKFNFPMAYSTTVLAWSLWIFPDGYDAAGQKQIALDSIKWALDYFIKCHPDDNTLYAQVGDGNVDHSWWGRPENMTMSRPAFKISTSAPGSDLAGEIAAAMAAGSLVFQASDPAYAATLLDHARGIYSFAYNYRGKYSDSVPEAAGFYYSYGYEDELAWGALWLYYATGEQQYMDYASEFHISGVPWAFSWDNKYAGAQVLMAKVKSEYRSDVNAFLNYWYPGGSITYTPKGLAWRDAWGSLRYAANAAAIALFAAKEGLADDPDQAKDWARSQINYILGDTGRSFVQGFGVNPPVKSHHRAASCNPDHSIFCGQPDYDTSDPNDSVLSGALVGGPDAGDYYVDDRKSYQYNEVACDYNAGFQAALAGLLDFSTG